MGDKENLLINDLEEELPPEEEKLAEKKEEKVSSDMRGVRLNVLIDKGVALFLINLCNGSIQVLWKLSHSLISFPSRRLQS